MKHLTVKQCAPFIGCEMIYANTDEVMTLIGIDLEERPNYLLMLDKESDLITRLPVEDLQLKLRDLSQMTEEEAIHIASMAWADKRVKFHVSLKGINAWELLSKDENIWIYIYENLSVGGGSPSGNCEMYHHHRITEYMIKQGFDVFGYANLIEE